MYLCISEAMNHKQLEQQCSSGINKRIFTVPAEPHGDRQQRFRWNCRRRRTKRQSPASKDEKVKPVDIFL